MISISVATTIKSSQQAMPAFNSFTVQVYGSILLKGSYNYRSTIISIECIMYDHLNSPNFDYYSKRMHIHYLGYIAPNTNSSYRGISLTSKCGHLFIECKGVTSALKEGVLTS